MRAFFAAMVALTLLGITPAAQAQFIPRVPGIPGGIGSSGELRPPLQPFTGDLKALTGSIPSVASLLGVYTMMAQESNTPIESITVRDFTSVANLRFAKNGTYELTYRAYWGPARRPTDPSFNGVEVKEQGTFSLSSAVLLLEPERTTSSRTKNGVEGQQEILSGERRAYVVRVTTLPSGMTSRTQSLTLVGRCPQYQLDSACHRRLTVKYLFAPNGATPAAIR